MSGRRSAIMWGVASVSLIMTACASLAPKSGQQKDVEAFMQEYTRVWNTHDSAQIAARFYRLGPDVRDQTVSLERQFSGLRAQGYSHSAIHEIKGCLTGESTAWAGMKYSRLREDGAALPPEMRASQYDLKKFSDGWRIVRIGGGDAESPLKCPQKP